MDFQQVKPGQHLYRNCFGTCMAFCICLALLVVFSGCGNDNSVPRFTRVNVSEPCGVAPLSVEFLAAATGGDRFDHPTGGTSQVVIEWDFGDGYTESGSLVYHTFVAPGRYNVVVVVRDRDGDTSSQDMLVNVMADSLFVRATSEPPPGFFVVGGRDTVSLGVEIVSCDFRGGGGSVDNGLIYRWKIDTGLEFGVENPVFAFSASDIGLHRVIVTVVNPAASNTRNDTLSLFVVPPPTLWLILEVDMSGRGPDPERQVFVEGSFNGFNAPQTPMARIPSTDRWRVVVDVGRNSRLLFRFLDGIASGNAESVEPGCSDGGLYRVLEMEDEDIRYSVLFGGCP